MTLRASKNSIVTLCEFDETDELFITSSDKEWVTLLDLIFTFFFKHMRHSLKKKCVM
jgi:hypothetical protein